jgi:hypothetical protein
MTSLCYRRVGVSFFSRCYCFSPQDTAEWKFRASLDVLLRLGSFLETTVETQETMHLFRIRLSHQVSSISLISISKLLFLMAVECVFCDVCLGAYSLTNPACNAPPYCHLQHICLHRIFRHYLIRKNVLVIKCFEIFLILRRIQRDIVINVKTSLCKILVILIGF